MQLTLKKHLSIHDQETKMNQSIPLSSSEAIKLRERAAREAIASSEMEGVTCLPLTKTLLDRWVKGEITGDEAVEEFIRQQR